MMFFFVYLHFIKKEIQGYISMKFKLFFIAALIFFVVAPLGVMSQGRAKTVDSIDAIHYDLHLDIGNKTNKRMEGWTIVTLRIARNVDTIGLELCSSDIDSVLVDGVSTPYIFSVSQRMLRIPYSAVAGDTVAVAVYYSKGSSIMAEGWGGFYFDDDIYYNLGIAIYEYPHNIGKAWFPCRDNFTDKATYSFHITAKPGWKAICTGLLDTVEYHADGSSTWNWELSRQTPTYLVGVAVAPFHVIERSFQGENAVYPAMLGFLNHDSTGVWNAYSHMSKVIPAFERCFGPYLWDRVGYVSTPKGSMEHVGNIAFTTNCMASQDEACLATMSHEFAHSWFGNLVTCATNNDMWINEGGASFCEEVAVEAIYADSDPQRYRYYARENLYDVLTRTHVRDDGFKPLYGQTPRYTYGSTVYNKGATVWHSLRGYLGDTLFYASLRTLFERCAFGNIDSWQLRDSLSLYSGVDLTDFFDFHVFNPGFIDYVVDSLHNEGQTTTIAVRQKSYGTDAIARGNKVMVTFVSPNGVKASRQLTFDEEAVSATFELPFAPLYAIVNYDDRLSLASLGNEQTTRERGRINMDDVHFAANINSIDAGDSIWMYVVHHWSRPDSINRGNFMRFAKHFWTVSTIASESAKIAGRFHYSTIGLTALDKEFISSSSEFGLVRLVYREHAGLEWREVSSLNTGSAGEGYFVYNNLKPGEYTLAMVDTSYVGVTEPIQFNGKSVRVCPNPTSGSISIVTDEPGEILNVEIVDVAGRKVMKSRQVVSGEQLVLDLPTGMYMVNVRNEVTGERSSIKMNFKKN